MVSVIQNGKVVTPEKIISGSVIVKNGKIVDIVRGRIDNDGTIYDAKGIYILPGLIETHGHFREPGFAHKETIADGTKAALAGGFTTVFDMPNTNPPITKVKLLQEQVARYRKNSHCDFAVNFGSSTSDMPELEIVDPREIVGIKVFTAGHQTTPTTIPHLGDQARIWEIAAKRKIPVLVHAENQQLVTAREELFKKAGKNKLVDYSEARNELVVEMAAWEAIILAKYFGTKIWILHASTRGEFDAISYAKTHGVHAGGEVTGYQLFFTTEDYAKLGTLIKVSPALRTPKVNRQLWQMVRDGTVDGICSEHTPHTLAEKKGNVWEAASGTPGIQETAAAFLTGWVREFGSGALEEGLRKLANCACTNVATFFGYPQKSGIKIGNDADLVLFDVTKPWRVKKSDLFTKLRWSAYEGMKLIGRPVATFLRGNLVYENGEIRESPQGKWLIKQAN